MKKTPSIKQFLAVLLTIVLFAVPFSLPVQAAAGAPSSSVFANSAEIDKAVTSIMNALSQAPDSFGFTKEQLAQSHIGSPIHILSQQAETPEHYTVYYPIICQDIIIGIVTVLCDNGVLYPSVAIDFAYQLNNLKNKEATYSLYNYNEKFYAVSQTETLCISENRVAESAELPAALTQRNAQSALSFAELTEVNPSITFNSPVSFRAAPEDYAVRLLDVKGLPQIDSNGRVQNICWAASLACILNYEFPGVMMATASDIAEMTGRGYQDANIYQMNDGLQTMMSWMKNILRAELVGNVRTTRISMQEIMQTIGTTSAGHPTSIVCQGYALKPNGERVQIQDENGNWVDKKVMGHTVTGYGYIRGIDDFVAIMDSNAPRVVRSDGKENEFEGFSASELLNGQSNDGYPIIFSRLVQMVDSKIIFRKHEQTVTTEYEWVNTLLFSKRAI